MSDKNDERYQKGTELLNTLFGRHPDELPWPDRLTEYTISHLFGDVAARFAADAGALNGYLRGACGLG